MHHFTIDLARQANEERLRLAERRRLLAVLRGATPARRPLARLLAPLLALLTACAGPQAGAPVDFALTLDPPRLEIPRGGAAALAVAVEGAAAGAAVALTLPDPPPGVTAVFDEAPGRERSTLALEVAADAPLGAHALTVRGRAGAVTRSAPLRLTVLEAGAPGTGQPVPGNAAPTLEAIADQTVRRNTTTPRSVSVDLEVNDPDDEAFSVTVAADDEAVVAADTFECTAADCTLTLSPSPAKNAVVEVLVTVEDGRGGRASEAFTLEVAPALLVTSTADGGAGSLRRAVAQAEAGDVIGFDGAFVAEGGEIALQSQIELTKDLTIEAGPGELEGPASLEGLVSSFRPQLDGGGGTRIFKVTDGASVVLRGLRITNGRAEEETVTSGETFSGRLGSGMFVDVGSFLTLVDSEIAGHSSLEDESWGGGIFNLAGTVTLIRSEARANSARRGGAIFNAFGRLTLQGGSCLRGNRARVGGGLYTHGGEVVLDDSCVGDLEGGGNLATLGGGGIFQEDGRLALVAGTRVQGNASDVDGGGVQTISGELVIRESRVQGNRAKSGGGIESQGALFVEDSTIGGGEEVEANIATDGGGGVRNLRGTVELANSEVIGNRADRQGGGIDHRGGTLVVTASHIAGNSAGRLGGGVRASGTAVTRVVASRVERNEAAESGGGIFHGGNDLHVTDSVIAGNRLAADGLAGGGIFAGKRLTLRNSTVADNGCETCLGGGIFVEGADLLVGASLLRGNLANLGGALFASSADVTLLDSTVGGEGVGEPNLARHGGGVYSRQSTIDLLSSHLVGNRADGDGGGIFLAESNLASDAVSTLRANVADADGNGDGGGGAVFSDAGDVGGFDEEQLSDNRPDDFEFARGSLRIVVDKGFNIPGIDLEFDAPLRIDGSRSFDLDVQVSTSAPRDVDVGTGVYTVTAKPVNLNLGGVRVLVPSPERQDVEVTRDRTTIVRVTYRPLK